MIIIIISILIGGLLILLSVTNIFGLKTDHISHSDNLNNKELMDYFSYKIMNKTYKKLLKELKDEPESSQEFEKMKKRDPYDKNKAIKLLKSAAKTCYFKIKRLFNSLESIEKLYKLNLVSENYYSKYKGFEKILIEERLLIESEAATLMENYDKQIFNDVTPGGASGAHYSIVTGDVWRSVEDTFSKSAYLKRRNELRRLK